MFALIALSALPFAAREDVACTKYSTTFSRTNVVNIAEGACALTFDGCCRRLHDGRRRERRGVWAVAFEISKSGCCDLFGGVEGEIDENILNGTLTPTVKRHSVNATGVAVLL